MTGSFKWRVVLQLINHLFRLLTHFGDSAFLVPLSIAGVGWLLWSGHRPAAIRFAVAVAALMAVTVLLKLGFYAIGGDSDLRILSPSGHAGFSVTVYGCGAAVVAKQLRPLAAFALLSVTALLVATVLASRVLLHAHTPEEVAMGSVLGLLCVAAFLVRNPDLERLQLRLSMPVLLALFLGSVSVWAEGRHFSTETHIERLGLQMGASLGTLPQNDLVPSMHGGPGLTVKRFTD